MWVHKYREESFMSSHVDKVFNLIGMNLLVYGNDESSIQYIMACVTDRFLNTCVPPLPKWEYKTYTLDNDKHTQLNVLVRQCYIYYEMFLQDCGSNDRHLVKHVINDISKNMGINTQGELCNKLIVLHNIDVLSAESLNIIAVFIEKHVSGSRFVFTTNNYNRVSARIKSHMVLVRIPNPNHEELCAFLGNIVKQQQTESITPKTISDAVTQNDCHMERSMNMVQIPGKSSESVLFDEITQLIKRSKGSATVIKKLRNLVYILLVNDKSGSYIISTIAKRLLKEKKSDPQQHINMIRNAALYEHRSCLSERYIYHLEAFFMSIL